VSVVPGCTGFLAEMARASAQRARRLAEGVGRSALERRVASLLPPRRLRLAPEGFDLVAEIKLASPALGALAPGADLAAIRARAAAHASGGAAMLSVLTEPTRFAGALAHLAAVAEAVPLPALRKDFLVDPLQVLEARASGAAGVLLVLRLLDEAALAAMLGAARECGLLVLLEVFEANELPRVNELLARDRLPPLLLGVNARDLVTLAVDPGRHAALAPRLPAGIPCVAESGLESAAELRAVAAAGYRLALVGGALMTAADPRAAVAHLLAGGRAGRGGP
jgi:indole-3-glycerol phosphate synthase